MLLKSSFPRDTYWVLPTVFVVNMGDVWRTMERRGVKQGQGMTGTVGLPSDQGKVTKWWLYQVLVSVYQQMSV